MKRKMLLLSLILCLGLCHSPLSYVKGEVSATITTTDGGMLDPQTTVYSFIEGNQLVVCFAVDLSYINYLDLLVYLSNQNNSTFLGCNMTADFIPLDYLARKHMVCYTFTYDNGGDPTINVQSQLEDIVLEAIYGCLYSLEYCFPNIRWYALDWSVFFPWHYI